MNEAGERDAVLLLGRSKGVSIADEAWLKVPLMKALKLSLFIPALSHLETTPHTRARGL